MDPEEKQKMLDSRMTKEEYDKTIEEKHRQDHPEDYQKQEVFLEKEFKQYASEKYPHQDSESLYSNPQILQMIYALEWYDVPRKDYGYLVEFHPYLTRGDHMRLEQLNTEHMMYEFTTFGLLSLIKNRFLLNRKSKFMQQRWLRAPCAMFLGGLSTYLFHITVMRTVYHNDLKEMNMDKYFDLDLDADMMRQDLKEMGIEVDAKYYDPEHAKKLAEKQ